MMKTMTMAIQGTNSPCVDTGFNPLGLLYDQRGTGYDRQTAAGVDIGAFEYGSGFVPAGAAFFIR